MKFVVVLVVVLVGVVSADDTYTTKYDGVDIDNILKNDRLLTSYFNCIMDKGKCSPDGTELKSKYFFWDRGLVLLPGGCGF